MGQAHAGRLGLDQYVRRLDVFERWKKHRDIPKDIATLLALVEPLEEALPINNNLDVNQDDG